MTLNDAYVIQMKTCLDQGLKYEAEHYETRIDFAGKDIYVSPDGEDVIRYKFKVTGCVKTRKIKKNDGTTKELHFHKDRLPVYGKICNKSSLKGFLYKYILFLRCDGIEEKELIRLYVLHCLKTKFEFWRKKMIRECIGEQVVVKYEDWELYEPDYADVKKMIEGLICSAMKVVINDTTREQFIVRTRCVVNPMVRDQFGGYRDKSKNEKCRDARRGCRFATDKKIEAVYDPTLTEEELARKAGVSVNRIQEWKADNRENLETLEDRIRRLDDRSLSLKKNAEIIGCSINSIRKVRAKMKDEAYAESQKEKIETEEDWINDILEKEDLFWKDVPTPRKKNDDDFDDLMELLDDLE